MEYCRLSTTPHLHFEKTLKLCVLSLPLLVGSPADARDAKPADSLPPPATDVAPAQPEEKSTAIGRWFHRLVGKTPAKPDAATASKSSTVEKGKPPGDIIYADSKMKRPEPSKYEKLGDDAARGIVEEVLNQSLSFNAPELDRAKLDAITPVPEGFDAAWKSEIRDPIWKEQKEHRYPIERAYSSALSNSTQVRSFLRIPNIQNGLIRENKGLFNPEAFVSVDGAHHNKPTGSILTTGKTGRFLEDSIEGELGVRKRLSTGAEVTLSQRVTTLKNNSQFLDPNPQSGTELVLSVAQPLLRGAGQNYVRSEIRIAELGRDVAEGDSLRLIEDYLLEVNRAYWGVYLSRAALAQRQQLTTQTAEILKLLEDRQKLDETATVSELFRAKAMMNRREADLRRTTMAVRTSEQKLRAMIKDAGIPMGASGELIPVTQPLLRHPTFDVRAVAKEALMNRAEMAQAVAKVRVAAVRRGQALAELKPQMDLVGEIGNSGMGSGRKVGSAFSDEYSQGVDWKVGLHFTMPIGNDAARGRMERRELEYQQSLDDCRVQGENILLQTLISYQDLLTAYQDMAGKYQSALASRKEIDQIRDRLKLDAQDASKSIAFQLQFLLSAIDRNQVAEEEFLVSVVAYNTSIAQIQRAQGVLLKVNKSAQAPVAAEVKTPVTVAKPTAAAPVKPVATPSKASAAAAKPAPKLAELPIPEAPKVETTSKK